MQIFVKTLNGCNLTISVEANSTVMELMREIEKKEGIPPNVQRLIYAGKQLKEELTMADYHIQKESTLVLTMRMLGGI